MMNEINSATMEIAEDEMAEVAGGNPLHGMQSVFLKMAGKCYEYTDRKGKTHQGTIARMNKLQNKDKEYAATCAKTAKCTILDPEHRKIAGNSSRNATAAVNKGLYKAGFFSKRKVENN